ncbi:hypothetical protein HELRODRAFT_166363 [Helobdella robusta]|uniref:ZP domain-containing protein n=1 Tax=Helobdella robusta TaxID=6412 RepID=T1EY21_HELRO|nr:hypothetical protein HELRODRAFT_166363 [Helobdella robusta]ESN90659.1 hypothetical protein HELRODRAFT_166363 [Helobdella robusta]
MSRRSHRVRKNLIKSQNSSVAPPATQPPVVPPVVSPVVPPAGGTQPPSGNGNATSGGGGSGGDGGGGGLTMKLFSVCLGDENCTTVANSYCAPSKFNEDAKRCACKTGFSDWNTNGIYTCELIAQPNDPACKECTENEGICILVAGAAKCQCPASKSGDKCENTQGYLANNTNAQSLPTAAPPSVTNSTSSPVAPQEDNDVIDVKNGCPAGFYTLNLTLAINQTDHCGTVVKSDFQRFATGEYAGIGVVQPNGNDRGVQVTANLKMEILNAFGQPLSGDAVVVIGDQLKFKVTLVKDENYKLAQVRRCYASSSFMLTDSFAEIRSLMSNGCPLSTEATKDSWYWTSSSDDNTYNLTTGLVTMFKMITSENVYLYCNIRLCLGGYEDACPTLTKENCTTARRKRAVGTQLTRFKRAASLSPTASSTVGSGIRVVDPGGIGQMSGTMTTIFAVVFSVLVAAVVVAVVVGALIMTRRKKNTGQHPERFAQPRVRTGNTKF